MDQGTLQTEQSAEGSPVTGLFAGEQCVYWAEPYHYYISRANNTVGTAWDRKQTGTPIKWVQPYVHSTGRRGIKNCTAQELFCTSSSGATFSVQLHLWARHLSLNSLYIPALIYWALFIGKPQTSATPVGLKRSLCCFAHCVWVNSYRRNRSNLLIRDARLLCPCYTHSFANTAAFIEATELLPSKFNSLGQGSVPPLLLLGSTGKA